MLYKICILFIFTTMNASVLTYIVGLSVNLVVLCIWNKAIFVLWYAGHIYQITCK